MTKNLLLSSTALVSAIAMATPALADIEVTLSGQVEVGSIFEDTDASTNQTNGDSDRGYYFFLDTETRIQAQGAADNGINYSGKVEIDTDGNNNGGGSIDVQTDEAVLAFWGGFGRIELGRDDGAEDVMYVGGENFQAGTGGIDGDTTNLSGFANINDSGDAAKITYFTPRVGGFQLGASFTPDEDDDETGTDNDAGEENSIGVGANFVTSTGGADITISGVAIFADAEGNAEAGAAGDDKKDYAVGVGLEFAGLGIGAGYIIRDDADEAEGFNLGISYGFGPLNVRAGYSYEDDDDVGGGEDRDGHLIVGSADYGVFPGVTLKGDVSHNTDDRDTADQDDTTAAVVTVQLDY
ncbi:MAG: porin [Geminicoccaceae bacterium]